MDGLIHDGIAGFGSSRVTMLVVSMNYIMGFENEAQKEREIERIVVHVWFSGRLHHDYPVVCGLI
jgi:hypothetical protein